jgi:hypothetical protein
MTTITNTGPSLSTPVVSNTPRDQEPSTPDKQSQAGGFGSLKPGFNPRAVEAMFGRDAQASGAESVAGENGEPTHVASGDGSKADDGRQGLPDRRVGGGTRASGA